jgi:hypothetical protein
MLYIEIFSLIQRPGNKHARAPPAPHLLGTYCSVAFEHGKNLAVVVTTSQHNTPHTSTHIDAARTRTIATLSLLSLSIMSLPSKISPSSRVVESESVQSQFAALTRDRDRLRWEVESADRQRRQQESFLTELRILQTSLSTKLQTAHASLGVFEKKKALLETERVRLVQLLKKTERNSRPRKRLLQN